MWEVNDLMSEYENETRSIEITLSQEHWKLADEICERDDMTMAEFIEHFMVNSDVLHY